jgi:hypothetical protein
MDDKLYKTLQVKKKAFLAAYIENGNITRAAEIAEIERQNHYNWINEDPNYVKAFEYAKEAAADRLEQEARRRAVEGVDKPIYYKGRKIDTIKEYSDTLLIVLLKGIRPEKFRENIKQELTGNNGEPIQINFQGVPRPDPEEMKRPG